MKHAFGKELIRLISNTKQRMNDSPVVLAVQHPVGIGFSRLP